MRTQVAVAVKRQCRSWSACALVSLGAIAAVCSLLISVEPVGILAQTPALAATPSAAAGWFHPFTPSSSESSDDAGAPAGACGTPIRVPKVCAWSHRLHTPAFAWQHSACGVERKQLLIARTRVWTLFRARTRLRSQCAWRRPVFRLPRADGSHGQTPIRVLISAEIHVLDPHRRCAARTRCPCGRCTLCGTMPHDPRPCATFTSRGSSCPHAARADPGLIASSGPSCLATSVTSSCSVRQVALCFLVRHAAHHDAIWRAWLGSAEGLLPTSAVHAACCAAPNRKSRRALRQEVSAVSITSTSTPTNRCCFGGLCRGRLMPAGNRVTPCVTRSKIPAMVGMRCDDASGGADAVTGWQYGNCYWSNDQAVLETTLRVCCGAAIAMVATIATGSASDITRRAELAPTNRTLSTSATTSTCSACTSTTSPGPQAIARKTCTSATGSTSASRCTARAGPTWRFHDMF